MLQEILLEKYNPDGGERVGFVLDDGTVVEVANIHPNPENNFDVSAEDLICYCDRAVATFHTHPGKTRNLSVEDSVAFGIWPKLTHYIIGSDGLRAYRFQGHKLVQVNDEA